METTTSGYVVLGMIAIGSRSGYEVRRSAELSLRHFWSISPPQIYSELSRLEDAKLIRGSDDPKGNRKRRIYQITADGTQALREWILRDDRADLEIRDLLQVKIFFADVLSLEETQALITQVRERSIRYLDKLRQKVLPAAQKTQDRHAADAPIRLAHLHVELHEFLLSWCDRVSAELTNPSHHTDVER